MGGTDNIIQLFPADLSTYNAGREKENNVIGNRIAEARKRSGMSLTALSKVLTGYGVSTTASSVNKWESGLTTPNGYQLMAISHALDIMDMISYFSSSFKPKLDENGMKKLKEYEADLIASGLYDIREEEEYIDMPMSDLRVSAGSGVFLDYERFETASFPKSSVPAGAEFGIWIFGNSMEPVYHDGDVAWVEPCDELSVGEVGIFVYDGCGYIKVYNEKDPDAIYEEEFTDGFGNVYKQPVLISYNCRYDPIPIIPGTSFKIVGKVLN